MKVITICLNDLISFLYLPTIHLLLLEDVSHFQLFVHSHCILVSFKSRKPKPETNCEHLYCICIVFHHCYSVSHIQLMNSHFHHHNKTSLVIKCASIYHVAAQSVCLLFAVGGFRGFLIKPNAKRGFHAWVKGNVFTQLIHLMLVMLIIMETVIMAGNKKGPTLRN